METKYLRDLIEGIVNYPDKVEIEKSLDRVGILLTLRVSKADMPAVIGKQGQTASAIRLLLKLYGFNKQQRISVKIQEPV